MLRRLLITLIIVVLLLIIGGVVWFFYFSDTNSPQGTGQEGDRNPIADFFFPAGSSDRTDSDQNRATTTDSEPGEVSVFRKISARKTAGFTTFPGEGNATAIRYIERATGHVYETTSETPTSERLTNTTLPRIQETAWLSGGESLYIRYLNEDRNAIQTFYGTVAEEAASEESAEEDGTQRLSGEFFPQDITELITSPNGEEVFTLFENQSGSVGLVMNADGSSPVEVFNTPSAAWNAAWPSANVVAFTTEPSREAFGFLYFLGLNGGGFEKILGDIAGLTTNVSPDTNTIIYSEGYRDTFRTRVYDRATGELTAFPIKTLPEKCVWSTTETQVLYCAVPQNVPEGRYPDVWYQGVVSFADALWRVDVDAEIAELVYTPEESLDIISPKLTENDAYFLFRDKESGTLWSLDLTAVNQ